MDRVTTEYGVFYAPQVSGKFHLRDEARANLPLCGKGTHPVNMQDNLSTIHVLIGTSFKDVHPILCRSCLRMISKEAIR